MALHRINLGIIQKNQAIMNDIAINLTTELTKIGATDMTITATDVKIDMAFTLFGVSSVCYLYNNATTNSTNNSAFSNLYITYDDEFSFLIINCDKAIDSVGGSSASIPYIMPFMMYTNAYTGKTTHQPAPSSITISRFINITELTGKINIKEPVLLNMLCVNNVFCKNLYVSPINSYQGDIKISDGVNTFLSLGCHLWVKI